MSHVRLNLSGHVNAQLEAEGFLFPGVLHIDPTDPDLSYKVAGFLAPLVGSGDTVTVALPGLTVLSAMVLATLHGLTGQFPQVQTLVRDKDGQFVPGPCHCLQELRNDIARRNRQGLVEL